MMKYRELMKIEAILIEEEEIMMILSRDDTETGEEIMTDHLHLPKRLR